jgi:aminoglycoside phosphotransferase (APT) family kinase protein
VTDYRSEIPLRGGIANRDLVVRKGDTVRRPQRATSPATHALLEYLAGVDFDGAPRFLGVDSKNREVLSYIAGEAVTPPYPDWALTDPALRSVAELLRRYHEAIAGFDARPYRWPPSPPDPFNGLLVCHNDPNLDNVVFRGGQAVALIDFDLASPGSPIWDVACAVRLWSPLRSDVFIADSRRGQTINRLRTFVQAYGSRDLDPELLIRGVQANHDWLYAVVEEGAERGNPGYADYWQEHHRRVAATRFWYRTEHERLVSAVADSGRWVPT